MLRTDPIHDHACEKDSRYQQFKGWLPASWEDRQKKLEHIIKVERIHLLEELYSGRLWAIGFVTQPDGFDRPTRVPRELFFVNHNDDPDNQPQVDWRKGELTGPQVTYFDIHILRPPTDDQVDHAGSSGQPSNPKDQKTPPKKSKRGRPSTRSSICNKINELWDQPDFQKLSNRTEQAREVRARLLGEEARAQDDTHNYKTSTIKLLIGEVQTERSK